MNLEFNPKKYSNFIIEEYRNKYKPEELTDDGIPTIETQLKELELKDNELKDKIIDNEERFIREMKQRVKCLSLLKMNKSIFTNTLDLSLSERKTLQNLMWDYNDIPTETIIKEFNEKICDVMDNKDFNYNNVPIYLK